ncbi:hypothetical protein O181_019380 [Austropuccinia psidii MF-1]|uniref:Chromo domain-containing protein n=1 Tax=Austropuccinia psidii MF-1 TaxID=1389203 RepID=A0A9Q3GUZ7_9BASI|nr:hypothetical protein [Austropuccinia psidii MF-1]
MEPDFKEGDQVLVSALNFKNLKPPKKIRDSFSVWLSHTSRQRRKNPTPPEIVEVEDPPGPVKKIIKGRKIRMNGKDQRQYLVRFKNQAADTDKWFAKDSIPDGNPHLRRFQSPSRTEKSHP